MTHYVHDSLATYPWLTLSLIWMEAPCCNKSSTMPGCPALHASISAVKPKPCDGRDGVDSWDNVTSIPACADTFLMTWAAGVRFWSSASKTNAWSFNFVVKARHWTSQTKYLGFCQHYQTVHHVQHFLSAPEGGNPTIRLWVGVATNEWCWLIARQK